MRAKFFVDNILVYTHDLSAGDKHLRAKALVDQLWTDRSGVLSAHVLQEFYVNVRRKARDPLRSAEAKQWIEDYMGKSTSGTRIAKPRPMTNGRRTVRLR